MGCPAKRPGAPSFHSKHLILKLKEFKMAKHDKNRIVPPQKKESQPPDKKGEKTGQAPAAGRENNEKSDETANLFEDHIREEKKEGD
jgi:hypothetical protein